MVSKTGSILIAFAGDVLVDRAIPSDVFSEVVSLLRAPDILFANLEAPYSDTPELSEKAPVALVPGAKNLAAYSDAGFHVMSLANNHIADAGYTAMLDTRDRLAAMGIAACGAGENISRARMPAVLERQGVKIGFLAYASIFPHGYEAGVDAPGLAPLRAYNVFHELPGYFAPGYLPRMETVPDEKDHEALRSDIKALREVADVVVVSMHWGDHLRPFVLSDHEKRAARFCIDHGADIVVGHHHHAVRGVEWYQGKPIFYGLGHFTFDLQLQMSDEQRAKLQEFDPETYESFDPESYAVGPREGWPLLPLHRDTRMTMLGWARVEDHEIKDVGFVPCRLRPDGRVVALDPEEEEGREVVEYIDRCIQSQRLNGQIAGSDGPTIGGYRSRCVLPLVADRGDDKSK